MGGLIGTVVSTVESLKIIIEPINKVVKDLIKKTVPKEKQDELQAIWEYVILCFLLLFSVCSALGFFKTWPWKMEEISIVFWAIAGIILIGAIKTYLWDLIKSRDKTIQDIKKEARDNEISLGISQKENADLKKILAKTQSDNIGIQRDVSALKAYIQKFDPEFNGTGFLSHIKEVGLVPNPKPAPSPTIPQEGGSPFPQAGEPEVK